MEDMSTCSNLQIQKYFLDLVESKDYLNVKLMLIRKEIREKLKLDQNYVHLAFIKSTRYHDIKMLKCIYELMKKDMYSFEQKILEKAFNAGCVNNNVDCLIFLENELKLVSYMMNNKSLIQCFDDKYEIKYKNLTELGQVLNAQDQLDNRFMLHGLLKACELGNDKIINYLMPKMTTINEILIEQAVLRSVSHSKIISLTSLQENHLFHDYNIFSLIENSKIIQSNLEKTNKLFKEEIKKIELKNKLNIDLENKKSNHVVKIKI